MNLISETKTFSRTLIFFFAFGLVFPTFRVLLIGYKTSTNILEYFISALPEFLVLTIITYSLNCLIKSKKKIEFNLFDWITLSFIVSNVMLGFILADNLKLSLYAFRMSYLPFAFYFLIRLYKFKDHDLRKMIHAIFMVIVALVVIGHILYFITPDLMVEMILKSGGRVNEYFIMRMTSICWTPVVFGTFAASGFLYFYYRAIENDKWINYLFIALMWSGLLLSVSRGAIVALIVGLIIFSCIYFRMKPIVLTLIIMTMIFYILGFYINSPAEFARWTWSSSVDTIGFKKGLTRVELWTKAFEDFKKRPFGHGLGMAGHVGARFLASTSEDADIYSTDGWFLKLANETGIWGLFSYTVFAGTYFIMLAKQIKKNKNLLLIFLLVFFIVFNIQSIVSNTLDFRIFSYLFWLMAGIAINTNQYFKKEIGK